MINPTTLISLLISLVVAYFVMFRPLFLQSEKPYAMPDTEHKEFDERISLLETIYELETDHKMGKLSGEDFEALSNEYKRMYLEKKQGG